MKFFVGFNFEQKKKIICVRNYFNENEISFIRHECIAVQTLKLQNCKREKLRSRREIITKTLSFIYLRSTWQQIHLFCIQSVSCCWKSFWRKNENEDCFHKLLCTQDIAKIFTFRKYNLCFVGFTFDYMHSLSF